ncbi:MAG TPA: hypothetical protein VKA76_11370 [Gammaproteobacteria bacterium]|nr:hypothetical protein [Gammaproteobacteria bacterium]
MKRLKTIPLLLGILFLTACGGGGGSSTANNGTVNGVATAAQVSVVTAN